MLSRRSYNRALSNTFSPRKFYKYAKYTAGGATAAGIARTLWNVGSKSSDAPGQVIGAPGQSGSSVQYRKRRRRSKKKSRYQRRQYKQFRRNLLKDLGTNALMLNESFTSNFAAGEQTQQAFSVSLNGWACGAASNKIGEQDLFRITGGNDNTNEITEKCFVKGSYLDLTFNNTSVAGNLEVDVYFISYKKNFNKYGDALEALTAAATATNTPTLPGGSTLSWSAISLSQRGVTPFQLPAALAAGMSIYKKKKHFVPPGGYFTENIKYTKPFMVTPGDANNGIMPYKGRTITLLFIVKKIVGDTTNTPTYTCGATRTYTSKIIQANKDSAGIMVNP